MENITCKLIGLEHVTPNCRRIITIERDSKTIRTITLDNATLQDAHTAGIAALHDAPTGTRYHCYVDVCGDTYGYLLMQASIEIAAAVVAYANRKGITRTDDSLLARLIKCAYLPYQYCDDIDNLRQAASEGLIAADRSGDDIAAVYRAGYRRVCATLEDKGVLGRVRMPDQESIERMQALGRDALMLPTGQVIYVGADTPIGMPCGLDARYADDTYMRDIRAACEWAYNALSRGEQASARNVAAGRTPSRIALVQSSDKDDYKRIQHNNKIANMRMRNHGAQLATTAAAQRYACLRKRPEPVQPTAAEIAAQQAARTAQEIAERARAREQCAWIFA